MKALNAQRVATVLGLAGRPGDPQLELRLLRLFQSERSDQVEAEPRAARELLTCSGLRGAEVP